MKRALAFAVLAAFAPAGCEWAAQGQGTDTGAGWAGTDLAAGDLGGEDAGDDLPDAQDVKVDPADDANSGARIEVEDLDFGYVEAAALVGGQVIIHNVGYETLLIHAVRFVGSAGFSFQWPCERVPGKGDPAEWIPINEAVHVIEEKICAKPVAIPAGTGTVVNVRYGGVCDADPSRKCPPEAEARMTFLSNDPTYDAANGEGAEVSITANKGGKCIQAVNTPVDFGTIVAPNLVQKELVLRGCGALPVTITGLSIVDADPEPSPFCTTLPSGKTLPYVLKPNENLTVTIRYEPVLTRKDAAGQYLPDTAKLRVDNDSPAPVLEVPLTGLPVDAQVTTASIDASVNGMPVMDGDEVPIQSTVALKQACTDPTPGGGIVSYEWSVQTSMPATEALQPNPFAPNVTYAMNVVGTYAFTLACTNVFGITSSATVHFAVKAPIGCHVELTWDTPLDPDQTDQCGTYMDCGADLDLHVVGPCAQGPDIDKDGYPDGFFDVGQYGGGYACDCMWFNPNTCWVKDKCGDPDYQPQLDLDDTDGAGPENFTYKFPPEGACFRVGVHYWDDHGFGKSYPTVRAWVEGKLIYQNDPPPKLAALDMWEVGEICCSAGTFKEYRDLAGDYLIIHNYVNPDFNFAP